MTQVSGYNNSSTMVTINGSNFDTASKVYIWSDSSCIEGKEDLPEYPSGVYVSGSYAYVADDTGGLQVIDISDPLNPNIAGSVDTPGNAFAVNVSGNYAYVADSNSGLQVIDISNPLSPGIISQVDTLSGATGVFISGNYAYVADGGYVLQVIDISNPLNPGISASLIMPDLVSWVSGIYISGDYVYLTNEWLGIGVPKNNDLFVIDISNPINSRLVSSVDISNPYIASNVFVTGDYIYLINWYDGMQMLLTLMAV